MVEKVVREPGRRIKRLAYGGSDQSVTKIAVIILKRFVNAMAGEGYWQNWMMIVGNAIIGVGNNKCVSQNLGQ